MSFHRHGRRRGAGTAGGKNDLGSVRARRGDGAYADARCRGCGKRARRRREGEPIRGCAARVIGLTRPARCAARDAEAQLLRGRCLVGSREKEQRSWAARECRGVRDGIGHGNGLRAAGNVTRAAIIAAQPRTVTVPEKLPGTTVVSGTIVIVAVVSPVICSVCEKPVPDWVVER